MTTTLIEARAANGGGIWLSVYHDMHTYTAVYSVAHSVTKTWTERTFKSFSAACHYFNKICKRNGLEGSVIW